MIIVSFQRLLRYTILTVGCNICTSLMRMWFPEVNGNLDICKDLANWAYGYKIWNIYTTDLTNRHLDKTLPVSNKSCCYFSAMCSHYLLNYSPTAPIEDNDVVVSAFFVKGEDMNPMARFNPDHSFLLFQMTKLR